MPADWLHIVIGPGEGSASVAQLRSRAFVLLLYGLLCMRIAGRRSFSSLTPFDIFIAIVVGSNINRVMTGNVPVVASLAATMVVMVLHCLLAMATMRSNWLSRFVKGKPDVLVRDGIVDDQALSRNEISDNDLSEALRLKGIDHVREARLVTFERGGKISVIARCPRDGIVPIFLPAA